jgi:hypothetical protein
VRPPASPPYRRVATAPARSSRLLGERSQLLASQANVYLGHLVLVRRWENLKAKELCPISYPQVRTPRTARSAVSDGSVATMTLSTDGASPFIVIIASRSESLSQGRHSTKTMETLGGQAEHRDARNKERVCSTEELEIDFTRGIDRDGLP